jgi:hypothetical protein
VLSEKDGTGAKGALQKAAGAGFELTGTPYAEFTERYFTEGH